MTKVHYLALAESDDGYPSMDFEDWYQQGMSCFYARFPKSLRAQALHALAKRWAVQGKDVRYWMLRAFAAGAAGRDASGQRTSLVASDYRWPEPPDVAWKLVVCCYPNGECDLDFVHPVSCRFWSEGNGFIEPPAESHGRYFTRQWYEQMGFDVILFHPDTAVALGMPTRHLALV